MTVYNLTRAEIDRLGKDYARLRTRTTMEAMGRVLKADGPKGQVLAVINTGYKDLQKDTVRYGAWAGPVSDVRRGATRPLIFWQHNFEHDLPLGSISALEELAPGDSRVPVIPDGKGIGTMASGLLATMDFAIDTERGRDAYRLVAGHHVTQYSVGFNIAEDGSKDDGDGGRIIEKVADLAETSLVVRGASLGTYTVEAKAAYDRLEAVSTIDEEAAVELAEIRRQAEQLASNAIYQRARALSDAHENPVEKWLKKAAEEAEKRASDRDYLMAIQFQQDRSAFAHCQAAYYRTLRRGITV